jgi:hypothetical protein
MALSKSALSDLLDACEPVHGTRPTLSNHYITSSSCGYTTTGR